MSTSDTCRILYDLVLAHLSSPPLIYTYVPFSPELFAVPQMCLLHAHIHKHIYICQKPFFSLPQTPKLPLCQCFDITSSQEPPWPSIYGMAATLLLVICS